VRVVVRGGCVKTKSSPRSTTIQNPVEKKKQIVLTALHYCGAANTDAPGGCPVIQAGNVAALPRPAIARDLSLPLATLSRRTAHEQKRMSSSFFFLPHVYEWSYRLKTEVGRFAPPLRKNLHACLSV
jgi:hypothetical protein